MTNDYLKYYSLEAYLFDDVHQRFHTERKLDAFDLFSIIIWKANRSKSRPARKLMKKAGTLEDAATQLTSGLFDADSAEARMSLAVKEWGRLHADSIQVQEIQRIDERKDTRF